jgi:hypothetical protein
MTARAPVADTLYKSDVEIARELGVPPAKWRANAVVLERRGLPPPDPMFDGKRYWPAVKAFLDRRNGLGAALAPAFAPDGEEHFGDKRDGRRIPKAATG